MTGDIFAWGTHRLRCHAAGPGLAFIGRSGAEIPRGGLTGAIAQEYYDRHLEERPNLDTVAQEAVRAAGKGRL